MLVLPAGQRITKFPQKESADDSVISRLVSSLTSAIRLFN
jgi:hypothetical protein